MFNRGAAAFKPSFFSRVYLLFFCPPPSPYAPVQMAEIWMLNFCLNVSFEKWNLKDEFFVCTFKCLRGPILPASLKTILSYPIQKSLILGGWGVDEEWNVPKWWFQQNEIPIVSKRIIVPRVEFSTESKKKIMRKDCFRGNSPSCEFLTIRTRRPFWCSKTIKRRPWRPTLWELNSFLM